MVSFDYTIMRTGRRVGRGKIARCPKCGRKGAYRRTRINKRQFDEYTHKAHTSTMAGVTFMMIDDSCSIAVPDAEPAS